MKKSLSFLVLASVFAISLVFTSCNKNKEPEDPEISFDITNNYMKAPVTVNFSNTSIANDNSFTTFSWDFKDGSTSDIESPTHEFTDAGFYTVDFKVTTAAGKTFGTSKYVTVYGNITGWEPGSITFYPEQILDDKDSVDLYVVMRDATGTLINQDTYYINTGTTNETSSIQTGTPSYELNLTDGSVTFELREFDGGDYVHPETDEIHYSCTINTTDVVPTNENGPYKPFYSDGTSKFNLDVDWIEQ